MRWIYVIIFLLGQPIFAHIQEEKNQPTIIVICTDAPPSRTETTYGRLSQIEDPHFFYGTQTLKLCHKQLGEKITLKIRGNSSARYAKKQYTIKFVDDKGENKSVEFLGMPEGKKWVFHSPYIDKSLMRNALAYKLARQVGKELNIPYFGPRTRFAEVILNDTYQGVYTVAEAVDYGKNRINIPKADPEKSFNPFIVQISALDHDFLSKKRTSMRYVYPSNEKFAEWGEKGLQAAKVKSEIFSSLDQLEELLLRAKKGNIDYQESIDMPSFLGYFIMQELTKNIDGFRRSMYVWMDEKQLFHMGAVWDFDIAFGNLRFSHYDKPKNWVHKTPHILIRNAFWYKALLKNLSFRQQLVETYKKLRQPGKPLHLENIVREIHSMKHNLGTAPYRDYSRWKGTYSFVQKHFLKTKISGQTYEDHVKILQQFITERLAWLDKEFLEL